MEYPIAITSKGVKLLNFNITRQLIFDDETIINPIEETIAFDYIKNEYQQTNHNKLITKTIEIEIKETNFVELANKLDSLIMKHYGEKQSLVILVTEDLARVYHHQRTKHGVNTANLPYVAIVACPIEVIIGRYHHNKFKVYE